MLKDKVAIVTGAASGIGLATAEMLAKEGARVVLADINETQLEAVSAKIGADALAVDLSKREGTLGLHDLPHAYRAVPFDEIRMAFYETEWLGTRHQFEFYPWPGRLGIQIRLCIRETRSDGTYQDRGVRGRPLRHYG